MRKAWAILAMASGLWVSSVRADPIERMIESLATTQSLSAEFRQVTSSKSARVRTASGVFYVSKPGLLRWEVRQPYPQLQILNSREFWLVDADLAQASVRSVEAANLSGIAALLLNTNVLTREQLLARYQFSLAGERDGVIWIGVVPRQSEPGITRLMIGLDSDSMISRFEIHDSLGQITRIELTKIFKNIAIDAALFQYTPPRGMSVLRQ